MLEPSNAQRTAGPFDLAGRSAVVTGGNGGIGFGIATGLIEAGAKVAIIGRDTTKLAVAERNLQSTGGDCCALTADVTNPVSVGNAVRSVMERWGRLDILVNNAGSNIRKPLQDLEPAEWQGVIDANLTSTYHCTRAVYSPMKAGGGGKIINIGSMMSLFGAAFAPAYGAAKGAVVQFTKAMAVAWAPDNIQVNAILPGWIETELGHNAAREIPGLDERVRSRTPAARWGLPEDIAGAAVFFSGRCSDFVTGAVLSVDGGYSAAP